jgi:CheY-like chemotaxis protein
LLEPESQAAQYLDRSLRVYERAKDITRQLLTFSRGGSPLRQTGDLCPVVKNSVQFALSGANVSVKYSFAEGLWPVDFDPNQIGQVIDNLVINSTQAMPGGGYVFVSAENSVLEEPNPQGLPGGRYVKLTLRDTGSGIPLEERSRVFEPYYTTKRTGSGLGLATVFSIVKKHGGVVDFESEVGKGTSFFFYLPASKNVIGPAAPGQRLAAGKAEAALPARGYGRILVMDDEEFVRDFLVEYLKALGYECVAVAEGHALLDELARAAAEGKPFRAAILDLTVRAGLGGVETAKLARAQYPDLPLFASSGYSRDPVMANPVEFGFTGSINKPYLKDELGAFLDRYLAGQTG